MIYRENLEFIFLFAERKVPGDTWLALYSAITPGGAQGICNARDQVKIENLKGTLYCYTGLKVYSFFFELVT